MKTLSNISPFILLLVPVFVMIVLTFTISHTNNRLDEVALKSSATRKEVRLNEPYN